MAVGLLSQVYALTVQLLPLVPQKVNKRGRCRVGDGWILFWVLWALFEGTSYRRLNSIWCSERTIRRRVDEWWEAGFLPEMILAILVNYEKFLRLKMGHVSVDAAHHIAPCGGEMSGKSPVNRSKLGYKHSIVVDQNGVILGGALGRANQNDSQLLEATLEDAKRKLLLPPGAVAHLDKGYDSRGCDSTLWGYNLKPCTSRKRTPNKKDAYRFVVERTHSWLANYRKLTRCQERKAARFEFWFHLAQLVMLLRRLPSETLASLAVPEAA